MRNRVTMPRWPAWVMFAAAAACAYPAVTTPPPEAPQEQYEARGQEPGWHLVIDQGQIYYTGNYGEVRFSLPRPEPRPSVNGRRYVTERLTVDISYNRCNDSMSGHGYEHEVRVVADGQSFQGCGGARRPDWDV